mgnify:CR=1 FL=1
MLHPQIAQNPPNFRAGFERPVITYEYPLNERIRTLLRLEHLFDMVMHFIMIFSAFIIPARRDQRLRNATVIVVRSALFAGLAWYSPRAALGYVVAYLIMMTILRFMDALQHDYGGIPVLFEEVKQAF